MVAARREQNRSLLGVNEDFGLKADAKGVPLRGFLQRG